VTRVPIAAMACAIGLLAAAAAGTPASAACMNSEREETAEGRLVTGRFRDAAGRPESAYIVQLARPACLRGGDEFDKVDNAGTIHVFSFDDAMRKRIARFVGRAVRVRGKPFGAHTAHHHAPIVMDVTAIEPR